MAEPESECWLDVRFGKESGTIAYPLGISASHAPDMPPEPLSDVALRALVRLTIRPPMAGQRGVTCRAAGSS